MKYYTLLAFIIALLLRLLFIGDRGIWYDEKASLGCSVGVPYAAIADNYFDTAKSHWKNISVQKDTIHSKDFHQFNNLKGVHLASIYSNGSVLYNYALHFWIKVVGNQDAALRLFSTISNLVVVYLIYLLTNLLFKNEKIALIAMTLAAIHPIFIISSQFVRSHSFANVFALLSTYFLLKFLLREKISLLEKICYSLCVASAMLSHYFTIYVFVGHFLIMIFFAKQKNIWLNFLAINMFAIIIFSIWLFNGGLEGMNLVVRATDKQFTETASNLSEGSSENFYIPATPKNIAAGWVQVLLPMFGNYAQNLGLRLRELILCLLIPFGIILFNFYKFSEHRKGILLASLPLVSYFILSTLLSIKSNHIITFQPIYSLYGICSSIIIFAASIYYITRFSKKIVLWGMSSLVFIQLILNFLSFKPIYEDYGRNRQSNPYISIAKTIESKYKNGDLIVCYEWRDVAMLSYYLPSNTNYLFKIAPKNENKFLFLIKNNRQEYKIYDSKGYDFRY